MNSLLDVLLHLRENFYRYLNVFSPQVWSRYTSQVQMLIKLIIINVTKFKRLLEDQR